MTSTMKRLSLATASAAVWLAGSASASILGTGGKLVPPPLRDDRAGVQKRSTGQGVFQQLIDHADPGLGTFAQRYWWSDEFYAGPGAPVVFFTPGEESADLYTGYLTNQTITGLFAQAVGGAVVMLEHRYWGTSAPFAELTTKNLRFLTLDNAIRDATYFARTVRLPFDPAGASAATADGAPWVFSGGSYSGALAAWTQAVDPGTFWAYHASSAVVEAIGDFWQYFRPVEAGMPRNCSADVRRVVDRVDRVLREGSPAEKKALKAKFGLAAIEHDDDFAGVLENGPWEWQSHDFSSGYSSFYQFCDYVENMWPGSNKTVAPGPEGVGECKALNGYAKWIREVYVPGACASYGYWTGPESLDCFDTYNASSPFFTDVSLDNTINRQWNWFLCNEPFKYWQDGAPADQPTIVSRLINQPYWERQCGLFFPTEDGYTYGIRRGRDVADVNAFTGGWSVTNTTRLTWTNGEFDPWRDSTVSSDFRPGGPLPSTPAAPVHLIPGGIHCSDLLARNGVVNAGVQEIIDQEVATIKGWVEEFYEDKGRKMPRRA